MNYSSLLCLFCTICLWRCGMADPQLRIRSISRSSSQQMIDGQLRTVRNEVEDNLDTDNGLMVRTKKSKQKSDVMSKRAAARMKYRLDTGVAR
ncbi:accessory gland-specific peptide 26Ab [Drosophila pseudoobscura]|uniref:Accessory gland-specific peptide 26Ab n=1 Tax=Drosophila pseudoobscura pseudoobscura TaxID=46245 RepID=A0A6I8V782_DROPS|nr:accessory gland-specific peptide 26Ab [Drosophila pseudoobscura]